MAITPTPTDPGRAIVYDTFSGLPGASEWSTTNTYQEWRTVEDGPSYSITTGGPLGYGDVYYGNDAELVGKPHIADVPVELGIGEGVWQEAWVRFEYRTDMADVGVALRTNPLAANGDGSFLFMFEPNEGTHGRVRIYKKRNDTGALESIATSNLSSGLTHGQYYWLKGAVSLNSVGEFHLHAVLRSYTSDTQIVAAGGQYGLPGDPIEDGVNAKGYAGIVTRATDVEQSARFFTFWYWDLTVEQSRPYGPTDVSTSTATIAVSDFVSGNRMGSARGWGATDEDATSRGPLIWEGAVADHPRYYGVDVSESRATATRGYSNFTVSEIPYWLPRKYGNHTIYTRFTHLNDNIRLYIRGQVSIVDGVPRIWGYMANVVRGTATIGIWRRNANLTFTLLNTGTVQGGAIGPNDERLFDVSMSNTSIGARCYKPGITPPGWQVTTSDATFANGYPGIGLLTTSTEFALASFEVQDGAQTATGTVTPLGVEIDNITSTGASFRVLRAPNESGTSANVNQATLRWREVGRLSWTSETVNTGSTFWINRPSSFSPGKHYEVQILCTGTNIKGGLEDDRNVAVARGFFTTINNGIVVSDKGLNINADEHDEQLIHVVTPPYLFDDNDNSTADLYYRLQGDSTWTYVGAMSVDRDTKQFSRSLSITTGTDYEFYVQYTDHDYDLNPNRFSDEVPYTVVRNRIYNATLGADFEDDELVVEVAYDYDDDEDSTAFVEYTSELNEEWTEAGYMTPDRENRKFNLAFVPMGGGDINLRVTLTDSSGVVGTNPLVTSLAGLALAVRPTLVVTEPSDIASIVFARFLGDAEGVSIAGFRYRPLTSQLWTNVDPSLVTRVEVEDEEEQE